MVFFGLTSKSVVTVFSDLILKPVVTIFSDLASKPVATVSSDLASKPVVGFFFSASKSRWWRVFWFGPQNR
jgi:hypothetical protein